MVVVVLMKIVLVARRTREPRTSCPPGTQMSPSVRIATPMDAVLPLFEALDSSSLDDMDYWSSDSMEYTPASSSSSCRGSRPPPSISRPSPPAQPPPPRRGPPSPDAATARTEPRMGMRRRRRRRRRPTPTPPQPARRSVLLRLQLAVLGLNLAFLHASLAFADHWDERNSTDDFVYRVQFTILSCIVVAVEAFSSYWAFCWIQTQQNAPSLILSGLIGLTPVHLAFLAGGFPAGERSAWFWVFWSFWASVLAEAIYGLCGRAADAYVGGIKAPKDLWAPAGTRILPRGPSMMTGIVVLLAACILFVSA